MQDGQTTLYLRSSILGGQVIAEMNAAGGWTRGYVYGAGGSLLAIQQENQVEYVHQDPVTKSQRLTNQSGSVTAAIEVGLFGDEFSRVTNNSYRQPHKYTTYERDANLADDAMHRRYNWWRSRFEQPDPFDGSYNLADPQSLNRYAYTQNDPVNFVDPSGLNMWSGGSGYGCDASYGSCGGGNDGGGGGGGGYGIGGGLFDSERFNPGSAGEAAYAGRLQNTYDAMDANRALQRFFRSEGTDAGAWATFAGLLVSNSTLSLAQGARMLTARETVDFYLNATGLINHIKSGMEWQVDKRNSAKGGYLLDLMTSAVAFLEKSPLFKEGRLGKLHEKDVGKPWRDFRSLTGDLGPRSLQITFNTTTLRAWADTDKYNPYQGARGFAGHTFREVIPNFFRNRFGGRKP